ncbi:MAG: FtsQ-type POTRA domain-containing protein [Gemmatimonadota bacterium]|nr:FtsQ-type POTRA domain-containing protein [Gemmatimonadota bacterium]
MKRRLLLAGAGIAAAVAIYVLAPLGLRQIGFFKVRQVQIVGLHYLTPEHVLAQIGLESDRNVFASLAELERRVSDVPGIVAGRVRRRLPGTLRFELEEEMPVAFARGKEGLVPLDEAARPLPYDPVATSFDLPLVERPDSVLTRTLALIRVVDSTFFGLVDGVRRGGDGTVVFELGEQRVVLRAVPMPSEIRAVVTVRRHLLQEGQSFRELDARFQGQIVVRRGEA